jgi:hypothetical protein
MKTFMALGSLLGFALGLSIVPASAGDVSIPPAPAQFHALARLLDGKPAPVPMTDEQLAAVEGMASNFVSITCINGACTSQSNSSAPSVGVLPSDLQSILQSNAAIVNMVCVNGACTTHPNSSAPSLGALQSNLQSLLQSILQSHAAVISISCVNGACTTQLNSSAPSIGVLQTHLQSLLQSILQSHAAVPNIASKGSLSVPILLHLRGPGMWPPPEVSQGNVGELVPKVARAAALANSHGKNDQEFGNRGQAKSGFDE